jgi:hypothetical protein
MSEGHEFWNCLDNLVASCQQAVDNLSTSWEQAMRTHPVDKLLEQHRYKSAAGLLQLVGFTCVLYGFFIRFQPSNWRYVIWSISKVDSFWIYFITLVRVGVGFRFVTQPFNTSSIFRKWRHVSLVVGNKYWPESHGNKAPTISLISEWHFVKIFFLKISLETNLE